MQTIEIPGGTVELRGTAELKVRHRRLIEAAAIAAGAALPKLPTSLEELESLDISTLDLSVEETNTLFALQDATIVAAVASWTLPEPLPTLETVGDLDTDVYDALAEATRDMGAATATGVDFEPSDPSSPGFEGTPTSPSGGSAAVSRADQESSSTRKRKSATKSSGSGASSKA